MSLEARPSCAAIGCAAIIRLGSIPFCKRHWEFVPDRLKTRIFVRNDEARLLEIRNATIHLARLEGRLTDVLILLSKLYETEVAQSLYLTSEQALLGGKVPIDMMRTPKGLRIVLEQLKQSAEGAYL